MTGILYLTVGIIVITCGVLAEEPNSTTTTLAPKVGPPAAVPSQAQNVSTQAPGSTTYVITKSEGIVLADQDEAPLVALPRSSEDFSNDPDYVDVASTPGEPEAKVTEKVPETKAPEAKVPEAKAPEAKVPEAKAPERAKEEAAPKVEPNANKTEEQKKVEPSTKLELTTKSEVLTTKTPTKSEEPKANVEQPSVKSEEPIKVEQPSIKAEVPTTKLELTTKAEEPKANAETKSEDPKAKLDDPSSKPTEALKVEDAASKPAEASQLEDPSSKPTEASSSKAPEESTSSSPSTTQSSPSTLSNPQGPSLPPLKPRKHRKKITKKPLSELLAKALKGNATVVLTRISIQPPNDTDPNSIIIPLENITAEVNANATKAEDAFGKAEGKSDDKKAQGNPKSEDGKAEGKSEDGSGKLEGNPSLDDESGKSEGSNPGDHLVPSIIKNPRVTLIGFTGKPVHTFNLSEHQILYQLRIFWMEPETWNDRGARPPNRLYDIFCWLSNDGIWARDIFRQNFSQAIVSHSQWIAVPEHEKNPKANLTVDCGLRPINSYGNPGDWSFNAPMELRLAPVMLRDYDFINVQGWTREEIENFNKNNLDKRRDTPQRLKTSSNECRQKQ